MLLLTRCDGDSRGVVCIAIVIVVGYGICVVGCVVGVAVVVGYVYAGGIGVA